MHILDFENQLVFTMTDPSSASYSLPHPKGKQNGGSISSHPLPSIIARPQPKTWRARGSLLAGEHEYHKHITVQAWKTSMEHSFGSGNNLHSHEGKAKFVSRRKTPHFASLPNLLDATKEHRKT